ncbi:MAG: Holliday junction resolvase RuvX [Rhodospirillaceae bacterium]|nr:Holliday junction resolvase RuvX [Rhodospirillaceae bacterium]
MASVREGGRAGAGATRLSRAGTPCPTPGVEALRAALPPDGRLLGLDVGSRTIGIAISDPGRTVASPLETIRRGRFAADAERLRRLVAEREVAGLVLGLPVNMDGSEGPRCQSVRQFAANLRRHLPLPMAFWDERLSTVAVTRTMLEADVSRARRAAAVDRMAAAYILQGALDALRRAPAP